MRTRRARRAPGALGPPPPDDPRGDLATIASGRSEWTPVGVFIGVTIVIAIVFAVAVIAIVIAYLVS